MNINFDDQRSILSIKPTSALTAEDFNAISTVMDPYIAQHGMLKGVLIDTQSFPGWKNIDGFIAHMKFIKNHRTKVQKVALVTDSKMADFAMKIAGHIAKPDIKHFPYGQEALAKQWLAE